MTALALPKATEATPALVAGTAQLTTAIAAVMQEIDTVAKRGENAFHRYRYARMEDILKEVTPLLGKHGIVIFQSETGRAMFDNDNVIDLTDDTEDADVRQRRIS